MKVNVISLKKTAADSQAFFFTARTSAIFPETAAEDGSFWQDGEITVEGSLANKGSTLEASGVIKAVVKCPCNLCLEETTMEMDFPFCREYRENEAGGNEADESDEADFNYYAGEEIDLKPLLREVLLLAQPLRQVCREECRGLCPECGTNLNITDCGCADKKIDARMSVLEKLLKNGKDS